MSGLGNVPKYTVFGDHLSATHFNSWREAAAFIKYCLDYGHAVKRIEKVR